MSFLFICSFILSILSQFPFRLSACWTAFSFLLSSWRKKCSVRTVKIITEWTEQFTCFSSIFLLASILRLSFSSLLLHFTFSCFQFGSDLGNLPPYLLYFIARCIHIIELIEILKAQLNTRLNVVVSDLIRNGWITFLVCCLNALWSNVSSPCHNLRFTLC